MQKRRWLQSGHFPTTYSVIIDHLLEAVRELPQAGLWRKEEKREGNGVLSALERGREVAPRVTKMHQSPLQRPGGGRGQVHQRSLPLPVL